MTPKTTDIDALEDYVTHHGDWKTACEIAKQAAIDMDDKDSADYWQHQIDTLDKLEAARSHLATLKAAPQTVDAEALNALERFVNAFKLHANIGENFRWETSSFGEWEKSIRTALAAKGADTQLFGYDFASPDNDISCVTIFEQKADGTREVKHFLYGDEAEQFYKAMHTDENNQLTLTEKPRADVEALKAELVEKFGSLTEGRADAVRATIDHLYSSGHLATTQLQPAQDMAAVIEALDRDIHQVKTEHANNTCTIEGCSKLSVICDLASGKGL